MREFADGEIAPGAAERDDAARFPSELIPKLASGAAPDMFPEEYGGILVRAISRASSSMKIARRHAAVARSSAPTFACAGPSCRRPYEQAQIPPPSRARELGAGADEPAPGRTMRLRTRATLAGATGLSGATTVHHAGVQAGTYVIRRQPLRAGHPLHLVFISTRETPGLFVVKLKRTRRSRADTASLPFDYMLVPKIACFANTGIQGRALGAGVRAVSHGRRSPWHCAWRARRSTELREAPAPVGNRSRILAISVACALATKRAARLMAWHPATLREQVRIPAIAHRQSLLVRSRRPSTSKAIQSLWIRVPETRGRRSPYSKFCEICEARRGAADGDCAGTLGEADHHRQLRRLLG